MANLSLRNVEKTFPNGVKAVCDFQLAIDDEEFVILVGPSGCGKTTTLRMIAGLEEITNGELYIGERLVNDVPPKDRDIAMVFQNYALYPHMTVFNNMAFGLKLRKLPKAEIRERVDEAARILDITHLLERKPKTLSGGQRQRVALGRAIVRHPQVFLLDEPLSNLDAKLRAQMRTELQKLHKKLKTTFIYVTHDQVEAMTMGDRIVVMNHGVIQQVDTPQNLYTKPCNKFVASFLGTSQMNFLDGAIACSGDTVVVKFGKYEFEMPADKVKASNVKAYDGKEVTIGIRPECFQDALDESKSQVALEANVDITELMGSETYIYMTVAGTPVTARVEGTPSVKLGDDISIYVDVSKIHCFDKETDEAIFN